MTKIDLPKYIKKILKKYPNISSGRKNFKEHHYRIIKTLKLIKEYFNLPNN